MTDRFTHDAAPYVLGALAPDDRKAFEEHLTGCAACTAEVHEFAGLPGLLSRLPVDEVLSEPEDDPEPPSVLAPVLSRARAERRARRWRAVLVGTAAAALAAVGSAAVVEAVDRPAAEQQTTPLAFTKSEPDIPASAEATLTDVPGGTRIDMTCRYSGRIDERQREYVLLAEPKSGRSVELGSWPVLSTDDYRMTVVAPLRRDQISRFVVTNATGKTLLSLP
ncbi:MAG TPA: zf-HC2 domain-containing protein [Mycobacteriales bacterium]|nr:zf-HC2 domain-containing protein [Mycobacteriales bacterium]